MNPVKYGAECQALVDAFDAKKPEEKHSQFWDDPIVDPVRAEIKDYYIAAQSRRCCYCNHEYPTDNKAVWDGEHIIPKDIAPHFMFNPLNLAAACKDCNRAKWNTEVRVNPKRKSFPGESRHYKIVHPHFDNYHDHIRWYGSVVRALSAKGGELVGLCRLWRFGVTKAGATAEPADPVVEMMLGVIMDPYVDVSTKIATMEGYMAYVKARPQKAAE